MAESSSERAFRRASGQPSRRGTVADVLADRLVREQADLLDDVADPAPELGHVPLRGVRAVEQDPPAVGSMSRLTILSDVVLPQPDGPTRTQILPAGIVSDRSLTAPGVLELAASFLFFGFSYDFETWSKSTVAARRGSMVIVGTSGTVRCDDNGWFHRPRRVHGPRRRTR